jgi:uncharacterized membrane protein
MRDLREAALILLNLLVGMGLFQKGFHRKAKETTKTGISTILHKHIYSFMVSVASVMRVNPAPRIKTRGFL